MWSQKRTALALAVCATVMLPSCGGSDGGSNTPNAPTTQPTPAPTPTPTPVPVVTVNGDWRSEARAWYFRLEQSGSTITGRVLGYRNTQYPEGTAGTTISGTIDANRNVRFLADVFAVEFSGRLEADGRRMTGETYDCGNGCRNYGEILIKQ